MGIGSMKGGLYPLIRGGGASSSGRPSSINLVTAVQTPATHYLEDFYLQPVTAPGWVLTDIVGTGGSSHQNSNSASTGVMRYVCGNTSGNTTDMALLESAGVRATLSILDAGLKQVCAFRALFASGATNSSRGVGWIDAALATGTDWISDPDTTFAANYALILTRHAASYSGDPAGDLILRYYDAGGVDSVQFTVVASASFSATDWWEIEVYSDGTTLTFYANGVLLGTTTMTAPGFYMSPGLCIRSTGAGAKALEIDYFYVENKLTTAR